MAMIAKNLGKGAAKIANAVDGAAGLAAKGAAKTANLADEVIDGTHAAVNGAIGDAAQGFAEARKAKPASYRDIRNESPRVQRQIEEGVRNADGTRKRKVKEAKVKEAKGASEGGDDVVSKAIQYRSKAQEATSFTYDGMQYTKAGDGNYYSRASSKEKASVIDQALYEDMHSKYVDEMTELGRQKDIDAAFGITMTAHEVWDGISSWAKEHPWHIAGGVAVGALLLDDD